MTTNDGGLRARAGQLFLLAILLAILGGAYSCHHQDEKERVEREAAKAAASQTELAKFATPDLARAEIERRLALHLVRDGLPLIVSSGEASHTVYVMPISIPWVISCDTLGLNVSLGTFSGSDAMDGVFIEIIPLGESDFLSVEKCKEIAPVLGKVMTAMTFRPRGI
jgi:hypothetical protein